MEQQELRPMVGEVRKPEMLPMDLVRKCKTKEEAILMCWNHRRDHSMNQTTLGKRMGLSRSHISRILSGQYGLKGTQERDFQYICGNMAIRQWCAWADGCELKESKAAELERQEQELAAQLELIRQRKRLAA